MPPEKAVELIEHGGLVAALILAVIALGWLYVKERNARTEEIKQFGDKYLEQSRSIDKVTTVLDTLVQKVERLEWEKRS